MRQIIIILSLFVTVGVHAQKNYEAAMNKALQAFGKKEYAQAAAQLQRLVAAEKDNWIPAYYLAMVETTQSMQTANQRDKMALIDKSRLAIEDQVERAESAEWYVLLALNYTAEVTTDPMSKGRALSGTINDLYDRALVLEPDNPRAVLGKAEFNLEAAKLFKQDIGVYCQEIKKALTRFDQSKPTLAFYPKWGKDRAEKLLQICSE